MCTACGRGRGLSLSFLSCLVDQPLHSAAPKACTHPSVSLIDASLGHTVPEIKSQLCTEPCLRRQSKQWGLEISPTQDSDLSKGPRFPAPLMLSALRSAGHKSLIYLAPGAAIPTGRAVLEAPQVGGGGPTCTRGGRILSPFPKPNSLVTNWGPLHSAYKKVELSRGPQRSLSSPQSLKRTSRAGAANRSTPAWEVLPVPQAHRIPCLPLPSSMWALLPVSAAWVWDPCVGLRPHTPRQKEFCS